MSTLPAVRASSTATTTVAATVAAVVCGYFLVMFAVSPVSVVLPSLAGSLGVGVGEASWVMTAFLLPLTACLLPAGRLGDIYGHRRLFTIGVALSAASAAAAGVSPGLELLLAARAAQGVGAALVSATSLPIITGAVSEAMRGRAIGLVTMAATSGAMVGSGVAPLFVEYLDWRWAFLSAAVVGAGAVGLALRLGPDARHAGRQRLDWPGAVLLFLALSVASLSLGHFHEGPETFAGGWHWHLPMHAAAAVLVLMFVQVERRVPDPLLRLNQLANGRFTSAVGANLILHMTMMMAVFALPFFVERGLALGSLQTGILLVTMQACTTVMTVAGGWLLDRTRSRWIAPLSMAMVATGLTTLGLAGADFDYARTFAVAMWTGIGSGVFMTTINTRIMSTLEPHYHGFASGMLETSRQYGHTLGVAVAATGLAAALSGAVPAAGQEQGVRAGFAQASLLMGVIAWLGVVLAAYPLFRHRTDPAPAPAPALSAAGAPS